MQPSRADRQQISTLGRRSDVADNIFNDAENVENELTITPDSENFGVFIDDPYVTQDQPAPSIGRRKFGRS